MVVLEGWVFLMSEVPLYALVDGGGQVSEPLTLQSRAEERTRVQGLRVRVDLQL